MLLQYIGCVTVVISGVISLMARKIFPKILKREMSDAEILKIKSSFSLITLLGAIMVVIPHLMGR